ncbi:MAG: VCBS repeat-containing protein, partial [Acidobacteriaceae bacterium]
MKNSWFLQTLFGSAALALLGCSNAAAQSSSIPPQDRFLPSVALSQHVTAEPALAHRLQSQSRTAISVAGGNFFGDANRALVTGYAVGSGGAIAVQRGSAQLPRPGEIDGVEPFSQNATFVDLGMRPDFLVSADMNQDGHRDLIVATRGGSQVMVLEGDGHGGFAPQAPFSVNGRIVGIEPWRDASGTQQIAAAVCRQSCSVDFYQASGTRLRSIPIDDTVTILKIARLNGGAADDIVAGGASNLAVIDGSSALTAQPRVDRLPVWGALAAATGEFVYDARDMMQIAVLTEDGSIHTLARSGVISTPPLPNPNARRLLHNQQRPQRPSIDPKSLAWIDVETLPGVATFDGSATPLLVRTRASGSGMDDLLVLNANGNRITTVRHPVVAYPPSSANPYAGTLQALPARVETGATPAGAALAAIPIRTSQDARLGLVTVSGGVSPAFAELPASRTLNVTTTADAAVTSSTITACENGGTCSLRSALAVVDSDATANETDGNADTVNVPVGTYTLGNNGPEEPGSPNPDQYGDPQYHIEIYGPVNLIGANTGTTIITTNNN